MKIHVHVRAIQIYLAGQGLNEPVLTKRNKKLAWVPFKDSDQPAHPHSLIRVFDWCSIGSQGCNVWGQRNLPINNMQIQQSCVEPSYSKTCLKWPPSKRPKIGFQDRLLLKAGQKYCRMLQESILQYFWPSLSYHLSLRPLFYLFLSGPFTQVLLYVTLNFFQRKTKILIRLCRCRD